MESGSHTAAADLLLLYASTQTWFAAEREYKVWCINSSYRGNLVQPALRVPCLSICMMIFLAVRCNPMACCVSAVVRRHNESFSEPTTTC